MKLTKTLFLCYLIPDKLLSAYNILSKGTTRNSLSSSSSSLLSHAKDANELPISASSRRGDIRRDVLLALASLCVSVAATAFVLPPPSAASPDIRGTPVTPFNSLMFQYRGNDFAGLRAEDIEEPSISYREFVDSLKRGDVTYVEFVAPFGDAAYATMRGRESGPIRIGEGYPIEKHDGYSSPAFAIRAVQNAGVPYKFVVPGLAKFSSTSVSRQ